MAKFGVFFRRNNLKKHDVLLSNVFRARLEKYEHIWKRISINKLS